MIIVLEGIDRVGKTTLRNHIIKEYGYGSFISDYKYVYGKKKFDAGTNEIRLHELDTIMNLIEGGSISNLVLDRYHISELVYGETRRKEIYKGEMYDLDCRLALQDSLLIHIEPTDIFESSVKHGSDLSDEYHLFKQYFESSKMEKVKVNYNNMKEEVSKWIK